MGCRAGRLQGLAGAGVRAGDHEGRGDPAVGHGDPCGCWDADRRGHAGDHLHRHAMGQAVQGLLPAAPKHEGVTALESNHGPARLRVLDEDPVDLVLRDGVVARRLAHVDDLDVRAQLGQHAGRAEPVGDHDVSPSQPLPPRNGEQPRIPRTPTHKHDAPPAPHAPHDRVGSAGLQVGSRRVSTDVIGSNPTRSGGLTGAAQRQGAGGQQVADRVADRSGPAWVAAAGDRDVDPVGAVGHGRGVGGRGVCAVCAHAPDAEGLRAVGNGGVDRAVAGGGVDQPPARGAEPDTDADPDPLADPDPGNGATWWGRRCRPGGHIVGRGLMRPPDDRSVGDQVGEVLADRRGDHGHHCPGVDQPGRTPCGHGATADHQGCAPGEVQQQRVAGSPPGPGRRSRAHVAVARTIPAATVAPDWSSISRNAPVERTWS